jgi:hypothetical protein
MIFRTEEGMERRCNSSIGLVTRSREDLPQRAVECLFAPISSPFFAGSLNLSPPSQAADRFGDTHKKGEALWTPWDGL